MLSQTTRASLLTRVTSLDDTAAWQEFCRMYGVLIQATARRCGLQQADCDDVTQAVFGCMLSTMPGFVYDPQRGRFRAYLKTVTLREVARWQRRARGRGVGTPSQIDAEIPVAGMDEIWESEWRQHHVRRALHRVESEFSSQDMNAFRKHCFQNIAPKQVAEELRLTMHQVYKAKTRILQRLREIVREQTALEL